MFQIFHREMTKLILTLVGVATCLTIGAASQTHRHHAKSMGLPIVVMVDQDVVKFDGTQPMELQGHIMVPIRGIFEQIGAYMEYDPANHKVTARRANESVELKIGNKIANKNGAEIIMEYPASIVGGYTMVPLRFIAESLGAKVRFDPPTNTVTILTRELAFGPGGGTSGVKTGGTGGG